MRDDDVKSAGRPTESEAAPGRGAAGKHPHLRANQPRLLYPQFRPDRRLVALHGDLQHDGRPVAAGLVRRARSLELGAAVSHPRDAWPSCRSHAASSAISPRTPWSASPPSRARWSCAASSWRPRSRIRLGQDRCLPAHGRFAGGQYRRHPRRSRGARRRGTDDRSDRPGDPSELVEGGAGQSWPTGRWRRVSPTGCRTAPCLGHAGRAHSFSVHCSWC